MDADKGPAAPHSDKFEIAVAAFEELFELLEEYAPVWFTEEHYNRALEVRRVLQKSRGASAV